MHIVIRRENNELGRIQHSFKMKKTMHVQFRLKTSAIYFSVQVSS